MRTTTNELLIIGNWKMNPTSLSLARKLFVEIRSLLKTRRARTRVVIAPPLPFMTDLARLSPSGRIELGAQDLSPESGGAFTGEVGATMLASTHARLVIIGHSERRARGESNEVIARKLVQALKQKMTAVLCIGELKRDAHGHYFSEVEKQLVSAFSLLRKADLKSLAIAYEPVWAIGTGKDATPADVHEMKLFIQKIIADRFGRTAIPQVSICYGGSVTPKNAASLIAEGQADGFLVGGASLRPRDFVGIISIAHEAHAKRRAS